MVILLDMQGHKAGPQKFLAKFKLLKILSSLNLADDFDSIENSFKSQIKNATYELKPERTPKFWWSEDLFAVFRRYVGARKRAAYFASIPNICLAKLAKDEWDQKVKEAKKKSFENKIEELNFQSNTKSSWKTVYNL